MRQSCTSYSILVVAYCILLCWESRHGGDDCFLFSVAAATATAVESAATGTTGTTTTAAAAAAEDAVDIDDTMTQSGGGKKRKYHFAMASGGSVYFEPIRRGWEERCEQLGLECEYHSENATLFEIEYPTEEDRIDTPKPCIEQMRQFIAAGVDGMAVKCNFDHEVFYQAQEAGIPIVTFSGFHPGPHNTYVGTDNVAMGRQMARLLKQLIPGGGTYVTAHNGDSATERHIGFVEEIEKDNARPDKVRGNRFFWMKRV
jgi:ABC-type sugar transport system substrate-binding protein